MTLYYHKCNDCLTPFSSTERHIDFCDCNGSVEFMGVVQGDKYVKTENRSPCDGRCTHAHGPSCDCECGGANHGTGRLVQVTVAEGKVKAFGLSEEDVERAHKFRQLRDIAERLYGSKHAETIDARRLGTFVSRERYLPMIRDRQVLDKILALKVFARRQNDLLKFVIANKDFAPKA